MKFMDNHDSLTDASIGRLLQRLTNADSCFAVIGARDKETGELRTDELYQLVTQYNDLHHNGYNKSFGRYEYTDGPFKDTTKDEPSIIIYNILLEDALSIAENINQESIVYKDKNIFGIYYTDGSVDTEFDNQSLSLDSKDDQAVKLAEEFGTKIADMVSWDNNHPKGNKSHYIFTAYAGRPNSWKHGKIINADTANLGISYSAVFKVVDLVRVMNS